MLRIAKDHDWLVGKVCKLSILGVELEKEYYEMFSIGNYEKAKQIHKYCYDFGTTELNLIFIDQDPFVRGAITWYCLKEIGKTYCGNWHWYTLNQLIICEG